MTPTTNETNVRKIQLTLTPEELEQMFHCLGCVESELPEHDSLVMKAGLEVLNGGLGEAWVKVEKLKRTSGTEVIQLETEIANILSKSINLVNTLSYQLGVSLERQV